MVRIQIVDGPAAGSVLELAVGSHRLGRGPTSDVVLALDSVSSKHLEVEVKESGEVDFQDLGSTNGTWSGGIKVVQGSWFPGSEIRLGACRLRLENDSGKFPQEGGLTDEILDAEDDQAGRQSKARAEAMSAKKKGGPLMLVLLLVGVMGAGWMWMSQSSQEDQKDAVASSNEPEAKNQVVVTDAIDDLGDFRDSVARESWNTSDSCQWTPAGLRHQGKRSWALLAPRFSVLGGFAISAEVSGDPVQVEVAWGLKGEDRPFARWLTPSLSATVAVLPMPKEADWYQLRLLFQGNSTLQSVSVEHTPDVATWRTENGRSLLVSGGNLLLRFRDNRNLLKVSAGGSWNKVAGGLDYQGGGMLRLWTGEAAEEAGPFFILADGGPAHFTRGLRVTDSPGLLIGGGARRFYFSFESPVTVTAAEGAATWESPSLSLRWDLQDSLDQAARLDRRIVRASREGRDVELLAAASELLRDWPLDDKKIERARFESQKVFEKARQEVAQLRKEKEDALFLKSRPDLLRLRERALALATRLPGTTWGDDAKTVAAALTAEYELLGAARKAEKEQYHFRLRAALKNAYPVLAKWLAEEEKF